MSHMWAEYYDSRKDEIVSFESDGENENEHDDEEAMMVDNSKSSNSPREPDGLFLVDDDVDLSDDEMPDTLYRDDPISSPLTNSRTRQQQQPKFAMNDNSIPYVNNLQNLRNVQPDKVKIYRFRTVVFVVLAIFATGMTLGFLLREEEETYMEGQPGVQAPVNAPTGEGELFNPTAGDVTPETPTNNAPPNLEAHDLGKLADVKDLLVRHAVSNSDNLRTTGSAEWNAMHWITLVDDAKMALPNENDPAAVSKYIQRYVMALLYYATAGQSWEHGIHWLSSKSICDWLDFVGDVNHQKHNTGIGCDAAGNIQILSLDYEKMNGKLPTEIGLLTTLKEINMAGNSIQGSIPAEICRLKNLEILAVDKNFLAGPLPDCFFGMIRLEGLGLGENLLTGKIPLGSFDNLKQLLINDNEFEGELDIGELTFLEVLDVKGNSFTGTVDAKLLGNLKNLQYVDLSDNELSSSDFPSFLLNLPNLGVLDISKNNVKGGLPTDIGQNTQLKYLAIHSNGLTGEIPYSIVNLSALTHANFGQNSFTGKFPLQFGHMTNLEVLYLPDLPGLDAGRMPDEFIDLAKLKILSLRNTNRNYFLPAEFSQMRHVEYLDVSHNNLTGGLPTAWGTGFIYMRVLLLHGNAGLEGDIPTSYTNMGALGQLFIQETNLGKSTLPSLCTSMIRAKGGHSIIDTCDKGQTECPCCMCCSTTDNTCGESLVGEYDENWDAEFRVGQVPSSR